MGDSTDTDAFKRALRTVTRSLAEDADLQLEFGYDSRNEPSDALRLSEPSPLIRPDEARKFRGRADSYALRRRYHDRKVHARNRPHSPSAGSAFDAMEDVRVESLGARAMPGVAANLQSVIEDRCRDSGLFSAQSEEEVSLAAALSLIVRERLTGEAPPVDALGALKIIKDLIEARAGDNIDRLMDALDDQEAYSKIVRDILTDLDLLQSSREDPDAETDAEGGADMDAGDEEGEAGDEDRSNDDAAEPDESAKTAAEGDEAADRDPDRQDMEGEAEDDAREKAPWRPNTPLEEQAAQQGYRVYTSAFDEIIGAGELASGEELSRLREQLDRQMAPFQGAIARLANRLQRRIMARQNRSWEFDLEEGLLDTGRLSRVVTNPLRPLSYKQEKEIIFRDTVVSLLIDNSGSMRGRPISIAAMSADILARTLERCGVNAEVLGFTTKAWKGGQSREKWLSAGKPQNPGRLNDIRHIIYKSADQPWRRVRTHMGLMLKEGLLKENIDGEALIWAHDRLMRRPEERRILMVISDGAPVDDSTLSTNSPDYLERHLRQVIAEIEHRSPAELLAIGIGHDVTRYYRRAVTITDAEQLGGAMVDQLAALFGKETGIRPAHAIA